MEFKRVGVLGAGNIGIGVVTDLVLHGISAVVVDISDDILTRAQAAILNNVRCVPLLSKTLPRITNDEAKQRMELTTDLQDVASCDFIIENVTEDWALKKSVYENLDRVAPPEICLGANTSCISITQIASATRVRPMWWHPPHEPGPLKPTVEVIRGFHTRTDRDTLLQLFSVLNKEAIIVQDMPLVSNRISHLFMNEAAFVLQDNVATADEIDISSKMLRTQNGPLETADLIGLDT